MTAVGAAVLDEAAAAFLLSTSEYDGLLGLGGGVTARVLGIGGIALGLGMSLAMRGVGAGLGCSTGCAGACTAFMLHAVRRTKSEAANETAPLRPTVQCATQ